jgi:hypothetical protein
LSLSGRSRFFSTTGRNAVPSSYLGRRVSTWPENRDRIKGRKGKNRKVIERRVRKDGRIEGGRGMREERDGECDEERARGRNKHGEYSQDKRRNERGRIG